MMLIFTRQHIIVERALALESDRPGFESQLLRSASGFTSHLQSGSSSADTAYFKALLGHLHLIMAHPVCPSHLSPQPSDFKYGTGIYTLTLEENLGQVLGPGVGRQPQGSRCIKFLSSQLSRDTDFHVILSISVVILCLGLLCKIRVIPVPPALQSLVRVGFECSNRTIV